MNESIHVKNTACPKCRAMGADRSANNLGVYDDGHCVCWRCGFYIPPDGVSRYKRMASNGGTQPEVSRERPCVVLPSDCDSYIPAVGRAWIGQYGITTHELIANRVMWSEKWEQLIFPFFDCYNNLVAWQGRSFNEEMKKKRKWFSQGDLHTLFHILPPRETYETIVLVEDVVSAIKLSRYVPTMPVFTSTAKNRLKTINKPTCT